MTGCGCQRSRKPSIPKRRKLKKVKRSKLSRNCSNYVDSNVVRESKKDSNEKLKVYLSVNIIKGEIKHGKHTATSWLKCRDVTGDLLNVINNIYKKADIEFVMKNCKSVPAERVQKSVYTSDVRGVEDLFNKKKLFIRDAVNIFLVPIISDDTNAYQFGTKESFIVQAENDPITWKPYTKLDVAQLIAHEIGHDLGLGSHSDDKKNLMYAYGPGPTDLDKKQIRKLRGFVLANRFMARSRRIEKSSDVISILEEPIKYKKKK